jgi:acetyltransferase
MKNLDAIFSPQSVAVIGASEKIGKVGHDIFANIVKGQYTGAIYPINPTAKSILNIKAYPSIMDVPDDVDLAMIVLPPKFIMKVVEDCVKKKVKGIVIVSAGFREIGAEGLEMENRIAAICKKAGVRLVGPNCLGVINPDPSVSLNASFSTRMPESGDISFISQSGALCTAVLDFAADRKFGFSKFISIGNKADVDELDLLRYLHQDVNTRVIMLYLEELRDTQDFIDVVKDITSGYRPTPILAIKSGRTSAGAQAAASHTGSLSGSEATYNAIFQQSGIIRVDTIDELFDFANAFAFKSESALGKLKRKVPRGNRIAIVTNAGGPGILATDISTTSGLELAEFKKETIDQLASHLPSAANLNNPVDVIGDASPDRYRDALGAVVSDDGVDGVLVILTPQSMTNVLGTAEAIVEVARHTHKPILSCFMGVVDVSQGVDFLQKHGYPVYKFPENAAKAFVALYQYFKWLNRSHLEQYELESDKDRAASIIAKCLADGKTYLGELDGVELLECYGFNVLPTILATSEDEAADIAENMKFPVVMKIVSPQILHKTDAGGVILGVETREDAKKGFKEIIKNAAEYDPNAEIQGVLVQKMAMSGEEVILGMSRKPVFGPLLMFGLGGIFVEVFKDVAFRLAPIGRNESRRMIRSIKGYKLLQGFRGRPKADIEILEKSMIRLSDMSVNHPEISEMDINPLLVHEEGKGATVADCRIILKKPDDSKN